MAGEVISGIYSIHNLETYDEKRLFLHEQSISMYATAGEQGKPKQRETPISHNTCCWRPIISYLKDIGEEGPSKCRRHA